MSLCLPLLSPYLQQPPFLRKSGCFFPTCIKSAPHGQCLFFTDTHSLCLFYALSHLLPSCSVFLLWWFWVVCPCPFYSLPWFLMEAESLRRFCCWLGNLPFTPPSLSKETLLSSFPSRNLVAHLSLITGWWMVIFSLPSYIVLVCPYCTHFTHLAALYSFFTGLPGIGSTAHWLWISEGCVGDLSLNSLVQELFLVFGLLNSHMLSSVLLHSWLSFWW